MIEPSSPKLAELVRVLLQRTRAGDVTWRQPGGEGAYYLRRRAGSVIVESLDKDGRHPYRLSVLDNDNNVVEMIESSLSEDDEVWDGLLESLFRAAGRSAAEATIAALLADVQGDAPPF